MADQRFTSIATNLEDLLDVVDVDDVADIETLLMFVFDRPIGVETASEGDDTAAGLEVKVWGDGSGIGSIVPFPMSVLSLVRDCAAMATDLDYPNGVDEDDEAAEASLNISAMDDGELVAVLVGALGKVRIFNILTADD